MDNLDERIFAELDAMNEHGKRTRKLRLRWGSALQPVEIGEYRVIPLTTSSELRKEGAVMRHCIGSHDILCAVGSYQVFSIRDQSDQRLATLSLVLDQHGWHLDQIKGPENAEVVFRDETFYSGERTETIREYTELYYVAQEIVRQYRLHGDHLITTTERLA